VGATRVAKARSSAALLQALRRRGRFATLRGLRRSHRRVECSALTRSKQASVPPKEIPPSGSALARSYTVGTISSSFPRKRESSKTPLFTGFPLSRERRKGFLKQLLLDASWKRPPALPCGSDACREGALQRDIFAGHSQKGSLRKPSRLAPLLQKRSDAAQATPRFPE
jgi:hypothetical protein